MEIAGQRIIVTGGANGIGRALCLRFAADHAAGLIVADLDAERASAVAESINALPAAQSGTVTRAIGVHCDVTVESDVQRIVECARSEFGGTDLFVSNAGITVKGGCEAADMDWQRLWNVNVMGHVYACRAVLPEMLARGAGTLLTTASAAGLLTEIGSAPYSATKHAAVALAEWLSVTYRRRGIKVFCLCPAGVATDFLDLEDPVHQFLNVGAVTPEHVAECVIAGLRAESFLILPHPEVVELLQFKTTNHDQWLHNFSRISEKLQRLHGRQPRQ